MANTWQMSPAPTRTALPDGAGTAVGNADALAVAEEATGLELSEGPAVAVAASGTIATGVDEEEGADDAVGDPQAASEVATSTIEAAAVRNPIARRLGFTAGSCRRYAGVEHSQATRTVAATARRIALQAGGVPRVAQWSSASWAFRCSPITFSAMCDGTSW
jgi:hypothetical protein